MIVGVALAACGTTEVAPVDAGRGARDSGFVERMKDAAIPDGTVAPVDAAATPDAAEPATPDAAEPAPPDAPEPPPPDAAEPPPPDAAEPPPPDAPPPPVDASAIDAPLPTIDAEPPAPPIDAAPIDAPPPPPTFDAAIPDAPLPVDAAIADAPSRDLCVKAPPTAVVTPTTSPPVVPGTATHFDVAVTNHDSAGCPARTFELHTRDATPGLAVDPFPGFTLLSAPAAGGETTHLTITATPSELLDGDVGRILVEMNVTGELDTFFGSTLEVPVADPVGCQVSVGRELMITNVSVVDDPLRTRFDGPVGDPRVGAWTFKRLVEDLAPSPAQAPAMVEAMIESFTRDQTINGFAVAARPGMKETILDAWPRSADGALDLRAAPFRLLAIVNRFDLRNLADGDAGQGRFIFAFVGEGGVPLQATIIFEYKLPAASEADVLEWARAFHSLGALPFSEEYNAALQSVTDGFVGRGAGSGPNGSAIETVRTNEIAFGDVWEMREFVLSPATGMLVPSPLDLTPNIAFNGTAVLGSFINANAASIIAETHTVPDDLDGAPFRAGAVPNDLEVWVAPGVLDNEARHHLSLNTCNGCHASETGTPFLHVHPRFEGHAANLSRFLTGVTVTDVVTDQPRSFADLPRRRADLDAVVCAPDGVLAPTVNLRKGIQRIH